LKDIVRFAYSICSLLTQIEFVFFALAGNRRCNLLEIKGLTISMPFCILAFYVHSLGCADMVLTDPSRKHGIRSNVAAGEVGA
jgi:hypothetical protein